MAGAARKEGPYRRVTEVLGAKSLRIDSPIELHERIVHGLPRSTVVHLVSSLSGISLEESMRVLNISLRTWHRIKAEEDALQKPLDVDQSARAWTLAQILAKAEEVLGTREEAEQWLARPQIGLDSHRPIELMATPQGADLVKTLLAQMEHGVYA